MERSSSGVIFGVNGDDCAPVNGPIHPCFNHGVARPHMAWGNRNRPIPCQIALNLSPIQLGGEVHPLVVLDDIPNVEDPEDGASIVPMRGNEPSPRSEE